MPAYATTTVKLAGNLSADQTLETTQTQMITSDFVFTTTDASEAVETTTVAELSQYTSGTFTGAAITVTGYDHDGDAVADTGLSVTAATTMQDILDHIESVMGGSSAVTVALADGQISVTDAEEGYSLLDIKLTFTNSGTADLTLPGYFEITAVGGEEVKDISIPVYDGQGRKHIMTGALVRTDAENAWDFVLTALTGSINNIELDNRRVRGLTFSADDGSYTGLDDTIGDTAAIEVSFAYNPAGPPQSIALDFGTVGKFSGLTQVAGASTAVATDQDGYEAGRLSTTSFNNEGTLVGTFSNGIRRNIATLQLSLFKNPTGLESVGRGHFVPTVNSGEPTVTSARIDGAGTIHGGSLEKSNADVATEFVSLIEAQNGYQANARTIVVANQILQTLTSLIR